MHNVKLHLNLAWITCHFLPYSLMTKGFQFQNSEDWPETYFTEITEMTVKRVVFTYLKIRLRCIVFGALGIFSQTAGKMPVYYCSFAM